MERYIEKYSTERAKNLLVVVAVEEYARRHGISAHETILLFLKYDITNLIRQCYETLHTQDIDECVNFAEDILKRKSVSKSCFFAKFKKQKNDNP